MRHRPPSSETTQDDMLTPERREPVQQAHPEATAAVQRGEMLPPEFRRRPWGLHRWRLMMCSLLNGAGWT
jgi:hypothetical protein